MARVRESTQQPPVPRGQCSSQCAAANDSRGVRTKPRSCQVSRSSACEGDGGGSSLTGRACCSCHPPPRCLASRTGVPPRTGGRGHRPYQSWHRGWRRASSHHWQQQQQPPGWVAVASEATPLLRVLSARAAAFVAVAAAAALAVVGAADAVRCAPPSHCCLTEDEMAEGCHVSGRSFLPSHTPLVSCGPHN